MAGTQKDKREREHLFSIYAKNLSIYFPDIVGKFLCPICKKLFSRDDLNCLPPNITRAHIIPRSLDGTLVTLSCKRCNDKIGYKFEKHLAKEKKIEDILKGKGSLPVRIKTDLGEIGADLSYQDSKPFIKHRPGQSNPKSSEKIIADAIKDWSKFKFSMKVKMFNPKKRNVAIIHSAFLMMFYYFGYEYVLSPNAKPVRDLILNPELWSKSYEQIVGTLKNASNCHCHSQNVSIIVSPKEIRSFLIEFPAPNKSTPARYVLLPGFGKDGQGAYNHILAGNFTTANLNLRLIPYDESSLTNPEFKWFAHKVWEYPFKI